MVSEAEPSPALLIAEGGSPSAILRINGSFRPTGYRWKFGATSQLPAGRLAFSLGAQKAKGVLGQKPFGYAPWPEPGRRQGEQELLRYQLDSQV